MGVRANERAEVAGGPEGGNRGSCFRLKAGGRREMEKRPFFTQQRETKDAAAEARRVDGERGGLRCCCGEERAAVEAGCGRWRLLAALLICTLSSGRLGVNETPAVLRRPRPTR